MPNVLLFGCDKPLVVKLREDSRWHITLAEHSEWVSTSARDPLHWNLVLDDCCSDDVNVSLTEIEAESLGIQLIRVNWKYLEEAERAHGITFVRQGQRPGHTAARRGAWAGCGLAGQLHVSVEAPRGHRTMEFNPMHDRAEYLQDFVDRFEDSIQASRICGTTPAGFDPGRFAKRAALFNDAYGDPLVTLDSNMAVDWLLLPYIQDKGARLDAFAYLCYRTAPKLWPDIYSDSFQPKKVQALEQEFSRMVAERRTLEREIEAQIDSERRFYAPYVNLTVVGDDVLKDLVRTVFENVLGCTAKDLDADLEEGQRKTLDLRVESGDWSAMVEVRSSGNRNAQVRDAERLDENYELAAKRHGETKSKVLVFNGMYWRDAEERSKHPTFGPDVVDEARARAIGLTTTQQLLEAVEAYRNGEVTQQQFIQAIAQPGPFEEPWK